ncbi:AfsR/SARP family transcriptional regulator [Streptomyces sp. NPDC001809]
MDIQLLGPISIRVHGTSIVPSAGKPRQILALLAIRAGHVVPVSTLMEEVWGERPPRSAATTLQTYILQLRRRIASAQQDDGERSAKSVLSTSFGGYLLDVPSDTSDWSEFGRLAARGTTALDVGDPLAATIAFGKALDLWRGPALVDVPKGQVLAAEVLGHEEAHMRVLEQRIEAELRLGRHASLVAELRVLCAKNPLHETLAGYLMVACYRSGNTWRALEVFQQLRKTLIEELGVEPSPRIQRLHQAVLACDPALDPATDPWRVPVGQAG